MKIILDHTAPAPLAAAAGFDLMITSDQSISYQQNLSKRRISLIVVGSNAWNIVRRHVDAIVGSVKAAFEAVA